MNPENRCAYLNSQHEFHIKRETIPIPSLNEVLVKIIYNGICGSDIHFYKEGRLGNYLVTKPYIPGHECSGIIVDVGKNVKKSRLNQHVVIEPGISCGKCYYCKMGKYNQCENLIFLSTPPVNGTFCDYVAIREDLAHPVCDNIDLALAALVEPTAVAINAVARANFKYGATGVIIGMGAIGLLLGQMFKLAGGGKVICIDRLDSRLNLAKNIFADEVINSEIENLELGEVGDVIFETAGSIEMTSILFKIAKKCASIVQVGWPGKVNMDISMLIQKELNYFGSYIYPNSFPIAIKFIEESRIDVQKIITHYFDFINIEQAFRFASNNSDAIKILIKN